MRTSSILCFSYRSIIYYYTAAATTTDVSAEDTNTLTTLLQYSATDGTVTSTMAAVQYSTCKDSELMAFGVT